MDTAVLVALVGLVSALSTTGMMVWVQRRRDSITTTVELDKVRKSALAAAADAFANHAEGLRKELMEAKAEHRKELAEVRASEEFCKRRISELEEDHMARERLMMKRIFKLEEQVNGAQRERS